MRGETIVCVGSVAWDGLWRSTQQIASRLAQHNRVLFFEPGRAPDRGMLSEARRNLPNLWRLQPRHAQDNLTVIPSPPSLPYARQYLPRQVLRVTMPLFVAANARVLRWHIRQTLHALDVRAPVLWLYIPYHVSLIGALAEYGRSLP